MTQHLTADTLRKDFLAVFGQEADQTFFSPGRINLIGEHTDYNGGHVFPAAISLGTYHGPICHWYGGRPTCHLSRY